MKHQLYFTFLLLAACLTGSLRATAQHMAVVYGNLRVENVNISISNTAHGTSTDANGHYELPIYDCTKAFKLYYSCIGYQDTVVSLNTRQLQRDSIHISFNMRKLDYNLQEVTVTSTYKLNGEKYYFMDFEAFDHSICILAAAPNKKQYYLIMADEDLRGFDTIAIPAHITPELVVRDCMGNCQLVANDSVYEIDLTEKPHDFIAAEKDYYYRVMNGCLFATDQHIYVKETNLQGYLASFYRIDRISKDVEPLFASDMTDNIIKHGKDMKFHIKWVLDNPEHYVAPFGIWSRHLKKNWFRPSNAELLLANDTLYYFDQSLGYIQHYDLGMNKIDSCAIQYPFMEDWHRILYQDLAQNRFFTITKDQLLEIDPISGNTTAKTTLNPSLYSKIVIHNGQLLLLKKAHYSSGGTTTFIERRKL